MPVIALLAFFPVGKLFALGFKTGEFFFHSLCRGAAMGTVGVHSHAIQHTIHSNSGGKPFDHLDRIFLFKVYDFRTLVTRHIEAAGNSIDGEDAPGVLQACAGNRELSYRPAAEYSNRA